MWLTFSFCNVLESPRASFIWSKLLPIVVWKLLQIRIHLFIPAVFSSFLIQRWFPLCVLLQYCKVTLPWGSICGTRPSSGQLMVWIHLFFTLFRLQAFGSDRIVCVQLRPLLFGHSTHKTNCNFSDRNCESISDFNLYFLCYIFSLSCVLSVT